MAFPFGTQREATFKDGCLSVRKNVLDNMRSRSAPGPIYSPKPRVSSRERSLRDITFGTSPARYDSSKQEMYFLVINLSAFLSIMHYFLGISLVFTIGITTVSKNLAGEVLARNHTILMP